MPSKPYQVPEHLQNWVDNLTYRLKLSQNKEDKIRVIMESHLFFERIHPFPDGNGRTGRALIVHSCLQEGFAPIVIQKEQKTEYIIALDTKNLKSLFSLGIKLSNEEEDRLKIITSL